MEIFGSSETGGIGWRQRHLVHTPGRRYPESRCGSAGSEPAAALPFLPTAEWLACADRIALHEGGFELLGRQDRVVKLEEKRISLDEVEARLQALAEVEAAAVLPLQQGQRQILGAVLVLSELGAARWAELGPGRFLLALRQQRPWLEPVALPRSVRRVEQMPVNTQGKRPGHNSRSCSMRLSVDSLPANTLPTVLACETLADGVRLQLRLDPDLPWFAGHFPGAPLLPGVTQIHWVMHYAASLLKLAQPFHGVDQLKFQRPCAPGPSAACTCSGRRTRASFSFIICSAMSRRAADGCD